MHGSVSTRKLIGCCLLFVFCLSFLFLARKYFANARVSEHSPSGGCTTSMRLPEQSSVQHTWHALQKPLAHKHFELHGSLWLPHQNWHCGGPVVDVVVVVV